MCLKNEAAADNTTENNLASLYDTSLRYDANGHYSNYLITSLYIYRYHFLCHRLIMNNDNEDMDPFVAFKQPKNKTPPRMRHLALNADGLMFVRE